MLDVQIRGPTTLTHDDLGILIKAPLPNEIVIFLGSNVFENLSVINAQTSISGNLISLFYISMDILSFL